MFSLDLIVLTAIKMKSNKVLLPTLLSLISSIAFAQDEANENADSGTSETIYVTGGKVAIETMPGSAALLDEAAINTFMTTDINSLLQQVPGVYIRQEDGYGLRPNIGLRGTSSERSTKITLMEDGILIAPAPYTAPAAYYTPNVASMYAVEVFKGPSAVRYGPHTVGGAINFVTRPVSADADNELEIGLGEYGYNKLRGFGTYSKDQLGIWVDALQYGADGFKELNTGADTGFTRNNLNTKLYWHSDESAPIQQALQLKLGYADEDSNETYLGLSDEDFELAPLTRYSASQLDRFTSEHTQVHLIYSADFNNGWALKGKVWHNAFDRSWNKFNNFINGTDINDVLANPGLFADEMDILRGTADSDPNSSQRLDVTNNDRDYASQGVELDATYNTDWFGWGHTIEAGIRYNNDYVNRNHVQRGYLMLNNAMEFDGETENLTTLNHGESDALALFVRDEILLENWLISIGLRSETIDSKHEELIPGQESTITDTQQVLLPGAGAYYTINDYFGVLAGINKGFSAKAASAAPEVDPEESSNYEYGFRFHTDNSNLEMIGFYSDYSNLLGRCRIVDTSCEGDVNGGEATVGGLELTGSYQFHKGGYDFPLKLVYTYTQGQFETSFESDFDQWGGDDGLVEKGDELPYLPTHQGQFQMGMETQKWSLNLAFNYTGEMREVAGQGDIEPKTATPVLSTINFAFDYSVTPSLDIKFVVDNLTDNVKVVSRRPIGARPNQPRTAKISARYSF